MQSKIIRQPFLIAFMISALCLGSTLDLIAAQGPNQLRIIVLEDASNVSDTTGPQTLRVQVQDANGRLSGAQVTFKLPDTGPGGSFSDGTKSATAVTDVMGVAEVKTFVRNETDGTFQIRVTASKGTQSGIVDITLINGTGKTKGSHKKLFIILAAGGGAAAAAFLRPKPKPIEPGVITPGTGTVISGP